MIWITKWNIIKDMSFKLNICQHVTVSWIKVNLKIVSRLQMFDFETQTLNAFSTNDLDLSFIHFPRCVLIEVYYDLKFRSKESLKFRNDDYT